MPYHNEWNAVGGVFDQVPLEQGASSIYNEYRFGACRVWIELQLKLHIGQRTIHEFYASEELKNAIHVAQQRYDDETTEAGRLTLQGDGETPWPLPRGRRATSRR